VGQKTLPTGNRLGIIRTWESRWFAKKDYANSLLEDITVRKLIKKRLYHAGISRIETARRVQRPRS
jgi:small subunit ribosomal protein S3